MDQATGPDGESPRVLKACAAELADLYTGIFNTYMAQAVVLLLFKRSTIVPKKSHPVSMNDFQLPSHPLL